MKQLVTTHELAGNYTVVIDTVKDKIYLDTLDCERPGITMEANMQGSLMMDVANMFRKYNIKKYPDVYEINDNVTGKEDLYSSIDTVKYRARTIRINDDQLRVFAPIILQTDEQIPDVFVLYRRDLSMSKEKLDDPDTKDEIVTVVDLHRNNISEYIQPKEYATAYIHGNSRYIKGIDSETGQFVKADLYSDSIMKEEIATEDLIYQSYKDKLLLYNSIVNISFVIKDDKIYEHQSESSMDVKCKDTSAYLYWGRYATLNRIEDIENITIESSWGSPEDTRKDIFVYKIQDDLQKPRLEYTGKSNPVVSLASKDILLRHHNGGFESITFDGFGGANLKYNEDHKSKYVDIDRVTYTIDSYAEMLPSMSFEYPSSECSLSILMSLNDEFIHYFNAVTRIDIRWVKSINENEDSSHCILLSSSLNDQIQKLKSIVGTYFNVSWPTDAKKDDRPIVTITTRGDNVLNFNYLRFTKTSRLNLIGIYSKTEINSGSPRVHLYEYSFTSKDSYAKIPRESSDDFISYARDKYIELKDVDNTCVHDKIHECFADSSFYYVRTGSVIETDDSFHYLCGGVVDGNTLSFYNMKASSIYTITPTKVGDFIDIRTAYLSDNEPVGITDDSKPVDVKTRVAWCDYSSVDKNGNSLIPSVASPAGIIDVYSAASSKDSWSYGQILYNAYKSTYKEGNIDADYFKSTCFKSDNIENNYLLDVFGSCFEDYPEYSDKNKMDFIKVVMSLMCQGTKNDDNNPFSEDTYTPLFIFEELPENICLASRLKSAVFNGYYTYLRNNGKGGQLDESDIIAILSKIGEAMKNVSINTASKSIKSYLTTCQQSVLDDITVKVNPVLYDDELFCMLFGVPFKTDIKYSEYTFRSIIVPCPRFLLRTEEDTKVYNPAITEFAINTEAKAFTIVTFLDIPVVMPFAMKTDDFGSDLTLSTMFGYFDRNMLQLIGNGEGIQHVGDDDDEQPASYYVKAYDPGYIESVKYLSSDHTYKLNKTSTLKLTGINYIDPETIDTDIDILVDIDRQPLPESSVAVRAARAISTDSGIRLAVIGHTELSDSGGAKIYPSKVVMFDKTDIDMKTPMGYFYTISASKEESHPSAYAKLMDAGIVDHNIDFYTLTDDGATASVATMVAYDSVFNNGVRALSEDVIRRNKYNYVAVVIYVIDPKSIADEEWKTINEDWKTLLKNTIEYGGAYYYFNSLMNQDSDYIKEYISGNDTFIKTKSGKLNSAITEVITAQCYPSSNQLLTYDIVDGIATTKNDAYIHMGSSDKGLMYMQYLSHYNPMSNKVEYVQTYEDIFDTSYPLTFIAGSSIVRPVLNYRTQRFVSLVVYDRRFVFGKDEDPINVTSLKSVPSILSSKYYLKNGEWINYKNNRSSVDIKLYPSILYGSLLRDDLRSFFRKIRLYSDEQTSELDGDDIIMYADTFMFHLYEYDLAAYYDTESSDFALTTDASSSSRLDYEVKKGYEQEYKNLPKKNMFFTYKMYMR